MKYQATMKILCLLQLLTVKSRILEDLLSNVNIVMHYYGMKKDLVPTNVLRICLLDGEDQRSKSFRKI
jgi:hypothetical protein